MGRFRKRRCRVVLAKEQGIDCKPAPGFRSFAETRPDANQPANQTPEFHCVY
jgi:hypothetical protein